MNAASFAFTVLQLLPSLISTGGEVITLLEQANAALAKMEAENRAPSDAEWSALNTTIDGLMGQLSGD